LGRRIGLFSPIKNNLEKVPIATKVMTHNPTISRTVIASENEPQQLIVNFLSFSDPSSTPAAVSHEQSR
jgi:hypothetical protein